MSLQLAMINRDMQPHYCSSPKTTHRPQCLAMGRTASKSTLCMLNVTIKPHPHCAVLSCQHQALLGGPSSTQRCILTPHFWASGKLLRKSVFHTQIKPRWNTMQALECHFFYPFVTDWLRADMTRFATTPSFTTAARAGLSPMVSVTNCMLQECQKPA